MRIGIDLDGTIADNLNMLVDTLNLHCGKSLAGDEIYQYSLCKTYSISETEFFRLMSEREEEIISTSPVIPYARRNIKQLVTEGWEVHIITARNPKYLNATKKWLGQNDIPFTGLHLLNSHDKLGICQGLGVKMMIEDNIHNGYQLAGEGIKVILFDAPHNRFWPWKGIRCRSWNQIYNSINKQV